MSCLWFTEVKALGKGETCRTSLLCGNVGTFTTGEGAFFHKIIILKIWIVRIEMGLYLPKDSNTK